MSKQRILGDLAHNLDSSAIGSFLAKSSAGGDFQTVDYSSITGTPSVVLDSSLTSQLIDSSYIQLRETPSTSGIDSATALNLIDSSYLSNINGTNTGFAEFYYNATAGQTIFDSDLRGRNLSYTEGGVMVFLNGVMLAPAQYTATDGTTVVLDSGASLSDEITVVKFGLGSSGGGGGSLWYGDRGVSTMGYVGGASNSIYYFDITTTGNASSFGTLQYAAYSKGAGSDGVYGLTAGGQDFGGNKYNNINYITIATTGNAQDFGDLLATWANWGQSAVGDNTGKIYWHGGNNSATSTNVDIIQVVTGATPGNATDYADLSTEINSAAALGNGTIGVINGYRPNDTSIHNQIDYYTFAVGGTAADFGDLVYDQRSGPGCVADPTYALWGGGTSSSTASRNTIDYITMATPGNAADFGDLTQSRWSLGGGSYNATRGVFISGYGGSADVTTMDYVTIATPGNATDFGDITAGEGGGSYSGAAS